MSAIQQLPKPEQLVDLVSHAAAVKLAMDGEFDKKIAELKGATKALADANTVAQTVEQAKRVKDDADAYAEAAMRKVKDAISRAQDATDKASSREAIVSAREQAVSARESSIDSRQATLDAQEHSILGAQNARDAAISAREKAVKKAEDELAGKAKKLASDQAAFNQKLEALKV